MSTRIVLRSRSDGLYVSGALTWSSHIAQAETFPNAQAADDFARSHRLKQMEIIVHRETGADLHIPLDRLS